MQKSRASRPQGGPRRKSHADAAAQFARAMARAEFGRRYVDDKQLEEVQRSLASAKVRRASRVEASKPTTKKTKTGTKERI